MTKMPPKKVGAAAPSKKTEQKKKEKVIEVRISPSITNPVLYISLCCRTKRSV